MKLSQGRFAATGVAGLTLAVVVVLFSFGVPEQQGCGGSGSDPQAAASESAATAWEGAVAKRLSDSAWDWKASVPLRITIPSQDKARGLPVWGDTAKILRDAPVSELVGAIDNWSQAVKSADGKC